MNWLTRLIPSIGINTSTNKSKVPDGLWISCPSCEATLYKPELEKALYVCQKCDHHLRIGARLRLEQFLDNAVYKEIAADIKSKDPLKFKDTKYYTARVRDAVSATGENEAILIAQGHVKDIPVVIAAFEFKFMGGSMGGVVGEKFVEGINQAIKENIPFICFSTSGGARMQESMVSLMQMAKTSAAIQKLKSKKLPYISVMVDPVYGGVSASLAMLGDINIAEPNAFVGFAGRRVIEKTVRVDLPYDFQKSEFLLKNGAIDMIVHRKNMRTKVHRLLKKMYKS